MFLLKARYDLDEWTTFESCICETIEEAKKVMLKQFNNDFDWTAVELPEEVHHETVKAFKNDWEYEFDDDDTYISIGKNSITVHANWKEEWYVYEIEESVEPWIWY